MNYYFDVKLNFLSDLYYCYEWDERDNIMDVKKVPVVRLSFNDFIKVYTNKVRVSKGFLEQIKNKTIINNGLIEYSVIFTDSNNSIACLFNDEGISILKSTLTYNDELNIEEVSYKLKKDKIEFEIIEKTKNIESLRFDSEMKIYVTKEINKIVKNKNFSKLKYIYNEVNKTNEKDINLIIKSLLDVNNNLVISIYNLLIFSKKNV